MCIPASVESKCKQIVDVGFILDSSGSLRNEYQKEKDFLKTLAGAFDISADVVVAAATSSSLIATAVDVVPGDALMPGTDSFCA